MNTMFTENLEKEIPKSLKDCYKMDNLTKNLWSWCERIEQVGLMLFRVLIVIGIICTIMRYATFVNDYEYDVGYPLISEATVNLLYDLDMEDALPAFEALSELTKWAIYAFIEYVIYRVTALLIGSLASIVQHTKITANVTLYNCKEQFSDDSSINNIDVDQKHQEYRCPKCKNAVFFGEEKCANCGYDTGKEKSGNTTATQKVILTGDDIETVIKCPNCAETLYFSEEETDVVCPYCLHVFTIE